MPVKTFVTYSGIQRSFSSEPMPNAYTFNPSGRFKFLKVFLWKFLMKHGQLKRAYQECELIKRIEIDSNSFAEKLFEERADLFDSFKQDAKLLLIGSIDYANLMETKEFFELVQFDIPFNDAGKGYIRSLKLRVVVIPWMSGTLLLPDMHKLKY